MARRQSMLSGKATRSLKPEITINTSCQGQIRPSQTIYNRIPKLDAATLERARATNKMQDLSPWVQVVNDAEDCWYMEEDQIAVAEPIVTTKARAMPPPALPAFKPAIPRWIAQLGAYVLNGRPIEWKPHPDEEWEDAHYRYMPKPATHRIAKAAKGILKAPRTSNDGNKTARIAPFATCAVTGKTVFSRHRHLREWKAAGKDEKKRRQTCQAHHDLLFRKAGHNRLSKTDAALQDLAPLMANLSLEDTTKDDAITDVTLEERHVAAFCTARRQMLPSDYRGAFAAQIAAGDAFLAQERQRLESHCAEAAQAAETKQVKIAIASKFKAHLSRANNKARELSQRLEKEGQERTAEREAARQAIRKANKLQAQMTSATARWQELECAAGLRAPKQAPLEVEDCVFARPDYKGNGADAAQPDDEHVLSVPINGEVLDDVTNLNLEDRLIDDLVWIPDGASDSDSYSDSEFDSDDEDWDELEVDDDEDLEQRFQEQDEEAAEAQWEQDRPGSNFLIHAEPPAFI
jgi:hypothetical protein